MSVRDSGFERAERLLHTSAQVVANQIQPGHEPPDFQERAIGRGLLLETGAIVGDVPEVHVGAAVMRVMVRQVLRVHIHPHGDVQAHALQTPDQMGDDAALRRFAALVATPGQAAVVVFFAAPGVPLIKPKVLGKQLQPHGVFKQHGARNHVHQCESR